ncbi:hypothetical protein PIB30_054240 [Stylosanthes scabra]|uniref:Uncharacterized protein n=1 Tax=Stylosanthes scabra TaxID=79078 RepID=A0ABU6XGI1_9FABA|nr:hypothetical protein [Stylosanthes scabra]
MLHSPLSLRGLFFTCPKSCSFPRKCKHLFCSNPISKNCKLLSGTVSLATFNNSTLSYANGYDEHTERECEEVGSEGMTFLACVVDSIFLLYHDILPLVQT